mmetsp:Transcript_7170/g.6436  ORF Transcript_7170/g.6436 Transcript_7170/m.6436 type:complete len:153 (+) Transcript_7170:46-504(+)
MTEESKIKMIKVLYDDSFGAPGLDFSSEFYEEYEKQKDNHSDPFDWRTDPLIIKIYEKLGSERCSKSRINSIDNKIYHDNVTHKFIPEEMREFFKVNDYDGQESIQLDFNAAYVNILMDVAEKDMFLPEHRMKMNRLKFIKSNYRNEDMCEY